MPLWKKATPKNKLEPKGVAKGRERAQRANDREAELRQRLKKGEKLTRAELRELGIKQGKLDPP